MDPALALVISTTLRSLAAGAANRHAIVEGGGVALLFELLVFQSGSEVEVHAAITLELLSAAGLISTGTMISGGVVRTFMDAALGRAIGAVITSGSGAAAGGVIAPVPC